MRASGLLLLLVIGLVVMLELVGVSFAETTPMFTELTTALTGANTEIRTSIFPAVAAILAAAVLIGVAGIIVSRIGRGV